MIFYILKDAPSIDADTALNAAHTYALQQGITGGEITVITNTKTFDITDKPHDVQVTEQ